jgi:hypothetical protein
MSRMNMLIFLALEKMFLFSFLKKNRKIISRTNDTLSLKRQCLKAGYPSCKMFSAVLGTAHTFPNLHTSEHQRTFHMCPTSPYHFLVISLHLPPMALPFPNPP